MNQEAIVFVVFLLGLIVAVLIVRRLERRDKKASAPKTDVLASFNKLKADMKPSKTLQNAIDTRNKIAETNKSTCGRVELSSIKDPKEREAARKMLEDFENN